MTAVVGVLCRDGVVIGTDSSATFGPGPQFRTIEQPTDKLDVIGEHLIIAGTGEIGLSQRFCAIAEMAWKEKLFQKPPLEVVKLLSRAAIEDMAQTYLQPGKYGALLAFPCGDIPCLCEFALHNFQPELKTDRLWYTSMGSAEPSHVLPSEPPGPGAEAFPASASFVTARLSSGIEAPWDSPPPCAATGPST